MPKLNPYLNFDGQAEEAFNFYRSVFGGDFHGEVLRFSNVPGAENIPENEKNRVIHIALPVGDDLLMASDIMPSAGHRLIVGNNNYVSIFPDTKEEADRLFSSLSAGGVVELPLQVQFWGDYYGSFTDKFGVKWMVNYFVKQ
ncbi:MAG: glyoxalase [Cytophagaceae bacterium SCN 52-12]|nr:MAG: glyoxalase [Cytophagaceae bacterium SCN 52-12]